MIRKFLIAFALLFVLSFQAMADGKQEAFGTNELEQYHWSLTDARTAQNERIDALFARAEAPVGLDFQQNRLNVRNICNNMSLPYSMQEGQIILGDVLVSTMRACLDTSLERLDQYFRRLLINVASIALVQGEPPVLKIKSNWGDTLSFTGVPTAQTLYGGPGEIMFMEVAAQTKVCPHPLIPEKQCLQVREVFFDEHGLKTGTGEWQHFYDKIEGYEHQQGIRNVLRVKRFKRQSAPADVSSLVYILDLVVETERVGP